MDKSIIICMRLDMGIVFKSDCVKRYEACIEQQVRCNSANP
jgi:hypothetical protein